MFRFTNSNFEKFRFVNRAIVLIFDVNFLFCDFRNLFFDFTINESSIFNKFFNSNISKIDSIVLRYQALNLYFGSALLLVDA